MSKIDQEIEEMAKSVEESVMTPKDQLIKTINEVGSEGIKAKMESLTKSEKEVLFSTLEEMKKSASPAMDADYAASYHKGKVYQDSVIQEDVANDDADEKLVKPKNAKMKNQGDNSPEGIEGQVIKGRGPDQVPRKPRGDGPKSVGEEMESPAYQAKRAKLMNDSKIVKPGTVAAEEQSPAYQARKKELYSMKKSVEAEMVAKGEEPTAELVKGKMKELLMEAGQSKDKMDDMQNDKVRGDKSIPENQNIGKENKAAQDKVDDKKQGQMKKSVNWADSNALLKSDRGGRNHHFSINNFYDEALAKAESKKEVKEDLKKSEPEIKDYDLNDLIEKDMTATWTDLDTISGLAKSINETNGQLVKSFETNEIAQALGLSEEEAKQILGE